MTRALVTQMLNALEHHQSQTRPIHKTEFAITAAREYLATEPSGERAELIARLAKQWAELDPADPYRADIGKAVEMLEADAQQAKRVPLSDDQIDELAEGIAWDDYAHDLTRRVEKHHGITEPEDLYALALKADNWGQP